MESVNYWHDLRVLSQALLFLCRNERPELVDVDNLLPVLVAGNMEVTHTNFTEVTGMVLIKVGSLRPK
jgi:hypothetical protein